MFATNLQFKIFDIKKILKKKINKYKYKKCKNCKQIAQASKYLYLNNLLAALYLKLFVNAVYGRVNRMNFYF